MSNLIMINKALFLALFLVFLANILMPFDGPAGEWIMWVGLAVLAVHILELVVMYKKLQAGGHLTIRNVIWILIAGILHWRPLLREKSSTE
jgi:uncharacterized protein YhhL (DUF1145 family)